MLQKVLIQSLYKEDYYYIMEASAAFELLPLTIVDETQDPPVVVIESELPKSSGLPVPEEGRVIDAKNADLDLKTFLEGTMSSNTKKSNSYAVKTFNSVMDSLRSKEGSETDKFKPIDEIVGSEDLINSLCKFFMVVTKPNGDAYNSASLLTLHSSLARYLLSTKEIDIRGDKTFRKVSEVLKARCSESAKLGKTPGSNKSEAAKPTDIHKAFESGSLGRQDPTALLSLIHFQLSLMGLRAIEEQHGVLNKDIVYGPLDETLNLPEWIKLSERLSKCRRGGKNQTREVKAKIFLDRENSDICPVVSFVWYQSKKTVFQSTPDFPFMLNPKNSAVKNPEKELFWYSNNRCGKNTISGLFKKSLERAGCDLSGQKITASSVRKNLIQTAVEGSVPSAFVSKMAAQKNILSQLEYIVTPDKQHEAASKTVNRNLAGKSNETYQENLEQLAANKENKETFQIEVKKPDPQPEQLHYGASTHQQYFGPPQYNNGTHPQYYGPQMQHQYQYGNYYGHQFGFYGPPHPQFGNFFPPQQQFSGNFYPHSHQVNYSNPQQQFGYYQPYAVTPQYSHFGYYN